MTDQRLSTEWVDFDLDLSALPPYGVIEDYRAFNHAHEVVLAGQYKAPRYFSSEILLADGRIVDPIRLNTSGFYRDEENKKGWVSTFEEGKEFYLGWIGDKHIIASIAEVQGAKTRIAITKAADRKKVATYNKYINEIKVGDFVRFSGQRTANSWRKIQKISDGQIFGLKYSEPTDDPKYMFPTSSDNLISTIIEHVPMNREEIPDVGAEVVVNYGTVQSVDFETRQVYIDTPERFCFVDFEDFEKRDGKWYLK